MNGRWGILCAGLIGGVLLAVGPRWLGLALIGYLAWRFHQLVRGSLILAIGCGLAVGLNEVRLHAAPPQPVGRVRVLPTDWTVSGDFVRFVGTAANGVRVSGSASVDTKTAAGLSRMERPAEVSWQGAPERLAPARNQYQFDYAAYAWAQNRQAWQLPTQALDYRPVAPSGLVQWLAVVRAKLVHRMQRLPPLTSRYALGLLLGQVETGFDELRATFVNLGIFHLFSVSGLHLFALIAGLYWLGDRLRVPKEWIDWGLILGLPALLVLIPPGAGILRAVWMRVGLSLNDRLRLQLEAFDVFAIVLAANVIARPLVLFTFGGQLTYLLCGALLLLQDLSAWQLAWRLPVFSAPVVLAQTFQLHVLTGAFNWLLMPVFELAVMPLLVVVTLLPVAALTGFCEALLRVGERGLVLLDKLPGLIVFGAVPAGLAVLGVAVVLWGFANRRLRYFWVWLACAYAVANWHPASRVVVFDVGQGDSILIEAPHKKGTMLIDTGGRIFGTVRNPPAVAAVANYLRARGYARLDTLVLTHADADHVGDAAAFTKAMPVTTVVTTPLAASDPQIQAALAGQVTRHQQAVAGAMVSAGVINLRVVAPSSTTATEKNADSLVLYGRIGDGNWLFTGDADQTVEKTTLLPQHLAVDYLKVGHHGSNTATAPELIATWRLRAALISAGVDNRYGHPHPQTLQTLRQAQVPVYLTATGGQISVEMTPTTHHITTFLKDVTHASQRTDQTP